MKKDWTHENCSKCMVRRYNQSARISKWAVRMEHRRPDPLYLIKPCVWECFWTSSTRKTGWIMATKSYKLQISLFAYFSSALGLVRRGKLEKKWCHKGGSCKSFASRSAFRFASASLWFVQFFQHIKNIEWIDRRHMLLLLLLLKYYLNMNELNKCQTTQNIIHSHDQMLLFQAIYIWKFKII